MHITASKSELSRIISTVAAAADSKASKPIFTMIQLYAEEKSGTAPAHLTALAGNGYAFLSGELAASVAAPGIICVDAADLAKRIDFMREGPISLIAGENLVISGSGRRYTIPISELEYPEYAFLPAETPTVEIDAQRLSEALSAVAPFACQEAGRNITCVRVEWCGDTLTCIATDAVCLAFHEDKAPEYNAAFSMDLSALKQALKIMKDGKVFLAATSSKLQIESGDFVLTYQLTAAEYVSWRAVYEAYACKDWVETTVVAASLISSVKGSSAVCDEVDVFESGGKLALEAKSERGTFSEPLDDETIAFERARVRSKGLSEAINATGKERVTLRLPVEAEQPIIISGGQVNVLIMVVKK